MQISKPILDAADQIRSLKAKLKVARATIRSMRNLHALQLQEYEAHRRMMEWRVREAEDNSHQNYQQQLDSLSRQERAGLEQALSQVQLAAQNQPAVYQCTCVPGRSSLLDQGW